MTMFTFNINFMRRKVNKDKKDYFFNSDIIKPGKPVDNDLPIDADDIFDDFEVPETCYMFDAISSLIAIDKPFGMLFSSEKVEKFLVSRGYQIVDKYFSHVDDAIKVATKSDPNDIPDSPEGTKYYYRNVFSEEVQEIILSWLLKISKGKN